jgi:endonuclease/exonuclease/phosphatase family metal-dependent hydrolase
MLGVWDIRSAVRRSTRWAIASALAVSTLGLGSPQASATAIDVGAERATPHPIRAITYNVGDGSNAEKRADLKRLMRLGPAVIGLQEVADRKAMVTRLAKRNGYHAYYEQTERGSAHNAVLVRNKGTDVLAHGALRLSVRTRVNPNTPGTGGTGWIKPNYLNWVRISTGGLRWTIGVVHLVPSAERFAANRRLHNKQVADSSRWFDHAKAEPMLMGDFNATPGSALMADLREVAKPWSKPSFEKGDRRIDSLWTEQDAEGGVKALGLDPQPDYSSDHRPLRLDASVNR